MTFAQFALIWPMVGISLVVAATLLLVWLEDRHERRKAR
jgi:hypothetical protein